MRYLLLFLLSLVILSSCKVMRSNLMLKTPRNFVFDQMVDSIAGRDYKIAPNDAISYRVFANNGFKLIDLATSANAVFRNDLDGIVQSDDSIKMPLIGRVHLAGLTTIQAEKMLEEKYAEYYVDPFVTLRITNKRIIVFPGNGGLARVLPMVNNNTSIMEALASAGGVLEDGKAYRIKVIRDNPKSPQEPLVFLMDLSKIEGITDGRRMVQAGDVIYVEPRYRPIKTFNQEIAPLLTLVASVLLIWQFAQL